MLASKETFMAPAPLHYILLSFRTTETWFRHIAAGPQTQRQFSMYVRVQPLSLSSGRDLAASLIPFWLDYISTVELWTPFPKTKPALSGSS